MPAPHDLDPPSMTEEERLAKRRQETMIAYEMHFNKILRDYYKDREEPT